MDLKRHAEHTTLDRLIAVIFHDFGPRVCFFPLSFCLSMCFLNVFSAFLCVFRCFPLLRMP
jgi:hypothetical protein